MVDNIKPELKEKIIKMQEEINLELKKLYWVNKEKIHEVASKEHRHEPEEREPSISFRHGFCVFEWHCQYEGGVETRVTLDLDTGEIKENTGSLKKQTLVSLNFYISLGARKSRS